MEGTKPQSGAGHSPLIWWVAPLIWGIILARQEEASLSPLILVILGLVSTAAALTLTLRRNWFIQPIWAGLLLLGGTFLAWAYAELRMQPSVTDPPLLPREAELQLQIDRLFQVKASQPRLSGYATVVKAPGHLEPFVGQPLSFSLWQELNRAQVLPGSIITVRGKLSELEPSADLSDFEQYLLRSGYSLRLDQGKLSELVKPASAFRQWCTRVNQAVTDKLYAGAVTERERMLAGVVAAMLLGKKSELEGGVKATFIASGTMHLFAVSGLHVGLIALTLALSFRILRLPGWLGALLGLGLLYLYVQIIGGTPSALRAFTMVACYWGALAINRRPVPFSALLTSALIVLLVDPMQLYHAGFQLSYTVVAAILLYAVPLTEAVQTRYQPYRFIPEESLRPLQRLLQKLYTALVGSAAVSLAAFLYSSPMTVAYFEVFAPGAILLNIILVPLAMLTLVAALLASSTGLIGASLLTLLFNHAAWILVLGMWTLVSGMVSIPGLFWQAEMSQAWLAPLGTALLLLSLLATQGGRSRPWRFLLPLMILLPGLVFGVSFVQG
ncbi:MAG: ComEC/Rec2 family competence protein [Verrucomicrobiota bacterium]